MAPHLPSSFAISLFFQCKSHRSFSVFLNEFRFRSSISISFHPLLNALLLWRRGKQTAEPVGGDNFQAIHLHDAPTYVLETRRRFSNNSNNIARTSDYDTFVSTTSICPYGRIKPSASRRSLHIGRVVLSKNAGFESTSLSPLFCDESMVRPRVKGCSCIMLNLRRIDDNRCISFTRQQIRQYCLVNNWQKKGSFSTISKIAHSKETLSDLSSKKDLDASSHDSNDVSEDGKLKQQVRVRAPYLAEVVLAAEELKRLRDLSASITTQIKINKHGITETVIGNIHKEWRRWEVVKVKCEGALAVHMKKTHEELENKTGGLVIWRAGSAAAIYRGKGMKAPQTNSSGHGKNQSAQEEKKIEGSQKAEVSTYDSPSKSEQGPAGDLESHYQKEVELVMESIGPRFEGWSGAKPVPIDGDLLPAIDNAFKTPVRLLPDGATTSLSDIELTVLRMLSRPLPTHFVLGRNKGLQGLAGAVVKLWERSEVVKIKIKSGVQHTRNQIMSEELKRLTGGILLSRDKYFISLYRGKDFLPAAVAATLCEQGASGLPKMDTGQIHRINSTSTASDEWQNWRNLEEEMKNRNTAIGAVREQASRRVSQKIATLMAKKQKAEAELVKVEEYLNQFNLPSDHGSITNEEKKVFREAGLKMDGRLMIGKSARLDVVIESMHSQWKKNELVKLVLLDFDKGAAMETVKILEHESGGIFVTLSPASKGQVVIFYKGDSDRPRSPLASRNNLKKGTIIKNCLRMKHQESLARHLIAVEKEISKIKLVSVHLNSCSWSFSTFLCQD